MPQNDKREDVYTPPKFGGNRGNVPEYSEPRSTPVMENMGGKPVKSEPEPKDIKPVPVVVVEMPQPRATQTLRQFIIGTSYHDKPGIAVRIINKDENRTKLTLLGIDTTFITDLMWIGHSPQVNNQNGWPLYPRATLELNSTEEVWGFILNPFVTVAWSSEYTIPVR